LYNSILSNDNSPLKVPKLSNRGSQTITSPLAFAEGLFYIFEKEGFFKTFVVLGRRKLKKNEWKEEK